jgi:hypothetical protein
MTNTLVWSGGKLATEQQGQCKNSTRGVSTEDACEQTGPRGASAENVRTLRSMYKTSSLWQIKSGEMLCILQH